MVLLVCKCPLGPATLAAAVDLTVDGLDGNSPLAFDSGNNIFGTITAGEQTVGTINQTNSSLNSPGFFVAANAVILADQVGSIGEYNIAGASEEAVMGINTPSLTIGQGGSGVFTQGANSLVEADSLVIQTPQATSGVYNLNGGALISSQIFPRAFPRPATKPSVWTPTART